MYILDDDHFDNKNLLKLRNASKTPQIFKYQLVLKTVSTIISLGVRTFGIVCICMDYSLLLFLLTTIILFHGIKFVISRGFYLLS